MDYNRLKDLLKERKISVKKLAELIGMSEAGLYQSMKNDTMTIKVLESISEILRVPMRVFWENCDISQKSVGRVGPDVESKGEDLRGKVIALQDELLAEKDRVIKLLEEKNK